MASKKKVVPEINHFVPKSRGFVYFDAGKIYSLKTALPIVSAHWGDCGSLFIICSESLADIANGLTDKSAYQYLNFEEWVDDINEPENQLFIKALAKLIEAAEELKSINKRGK